MLRSDIGYWGYFFGISAMEFEPWIGSHYIVEDIPSALLEVWNNPPEVDPSLHLPLRNGFIPCDFSLRNVNMSKNDMDTIYPKCIIDQPLVKLWYKIDTTFKVPRANTYFLITVKDGYNSVKTSVMTELFVNLLKVALNEILYQADVAKLVTSISIIIDKLELKLYGFNDKLSTLLSKILKLSKSFSPATDRFEDTLDDEIFENHRNGLIADKLEKDPSLTYETGSHWAQTTDKRYLFDMMKVEAEELKTISKTDVIIWYNTYLRSPSPKCRQLAIYAWGCCNANMHKEAQTPGKFNGNIIDKVDSFKKSSDFYSGLS